MDTSDASGRRLPSATRRLSLTAGSIKVARSLGEHPVGAMYEGLGAVDEASFWLDEKTAPTHLASTPVFDAGDQQRPNDRVDADAIRSLIAPKA